MKLLITSLIFTLAAGRIVFKTPEEEAVLDAGNLYFSVTSHDGKTDPAKIFSKQMIQLELQDNKLD